MIKHWMLGLPRESRHIAIVAMLLSVILAVTFLTVTVSDFISAWKRIDNAEPRIARLLGYEAVEDDLEGAEDDSRQRLGQFSFTGTTDISRQGARLQQTLRAFASEAGLTVIGSQFVREVESDLNVSDQFALLGVDLTMNGPPLALDTFLRDVYDHEPALKVSSLSLQQPRRSRTPSGSEASEDINIRVNVAALMLAGQ